MKPRKGALKAVPEKAPEKVTEVAVPDQEVIDPPYLAHQLRLTGASWREVVEATGYRNEAEARAAVDRYILQGALSRTAEQQRNAFQLQLQRYEAVLRAWWTRGVKTHDDKAAGVVLRTLAQLDKLQRFGEAEVDATVRAVVIAGTREEYIAGLKAVVEGRGDELLAQDDDPAE